MSRINNDEIVNPSTRWFKWSGSEGKLQYYDKEKKENVGVAMPFVFLLLDELQTITGFNKALEDGFYSNEVKDLKTTKLRVRCGKTDFANGLYDQIKDQLKANGGKYAQSCYIAYKDTDQQLKIGNILFAGSSLGGGTYKDANKKEVEIPGWMTFRHANRGEIYKQAIIMDCNPQVCVNGATKYKVPSFELKEVSEDTDARAKQLNVELEAYLSIYLAKAERVEANQAPAPQQEVVAGEKVSNEKIDISNTSETVEDKDPWEKEMDDSLPF